MLKTRAVLIAFLVFGCEKSKNIEIEYTLGKKWVYKLKGYKASYPILPPKMPKLEHSETTGINTYEKNDTIYTEIAGSENDFGVTKKVNLNIENSIVGEHLDTIEVIKVRSDTVFFNKYLLPGWSNKLYIKNKRYKFTL